MSKIPEGFENIDEADYEKINAKLSEKGVKFGPCELCGKTDWHSGPALMSPMVLMRNSSSKALKTITDLSVNQIAFSCGNCGNTKYLELHFLGVTLSKEAKGG